jgi:hypothetical protein
MIILSMAIDDYSINGYCAYFINGYWYLLMATILVDIGDY